MKRFSRLQLVLALAAIGLLALSIFFVFSYFSESGKTGKLESDIRTKQAQINSLAVCDLNDKNTQLEECINKLAYNSSFPFQTYDSKEITNAIIGVVADTRVTLEGLDHSGISGVVFGTTPYQVDNYHLSCSVDVGKSNSLIVLLELFEELREEKYHTLLIQNVQLPASRTEISFDIGLVTQVIPQ